MSTVTMNFDLSKLADRHHYETVMNAEKYRLILEDLARSLAEQESSQLPHVRGAAHAALPLLGELAQKHALPGLQSYLNRLRQKAPAVDATP